MFEFGNLRSSVCVWGRIASRIGRSGSGRAKVERVPPEISLPHQQLSIFSTSNDLRGSRSAVLQTFGSSTNHPLQWNIQLVPSCSLSPANISTQAPSTPAPPDLARSPPRQLLTFNPIFNLQLDHEAKDETINDLRHRRRPLGGLRPCESAHWLAQDRRVYAQGHHRDFGASRLPKELIEVQNRPRRLICDTTDADKNEWPLTRKIWYDSFFAAHSTCH